MGGYVPTAIVRSSCDDHDSVPWSSSAEPRGTERAVAVKAMILALGWLYSVSTLPCVDEDGGGGLPSGAVDARRGAPNRGLGGSIVARADRIGGCGIQLVVIGWEYGNAAVIMREGSRAVAVIRGASRWQSHDCECVAGIVNQVASLNIQPRQ